MPNTTTVTDKSVSKKRPLDVDEEETTLATKRVYSIFTKQASASTSASATEAPTGPFQWLKPTLGPKKTCLHGINLTPPIRSRVAAFDLDGTVIRSSFSKKPSLGWEWWWHKKVPAKLKEVHDDGYSVVLITNQNINAAQLKSWKEKVPLIAKALPDVPFRILAAIARDQYRKPMPGMWIELVRIAREAGVELDKDASFYVGDAAGRKGDFAGTDRKWALNIGVRFYTPEEYFLDLPATPYTLEGFHVSNLPQNVPLVTPSSTPLLPTGKDAASPEVAIFVGYPATGKTAFYRQHFAPAGYVHINQDTIGTRAKCVKALQEALRDGKSCVVDNTNRDKKTRKHYVDAARALGASVRCFIFGGSIELAWHNNLYRALCYSFRSSPDPVIKRDLVPYLAFTSFREAYEEPSLEEGLREVKRINWVFEGDGEDRTFWNMWLQIDGK